MTRWYKPAVSILTWRILVTLSRFGFPHWRVAGFAGGKLLADLFECTASSKSCPHQECRHRQITADRRPGELAFSQAVDRTKIY